MRTLASRWLVACVCIVALMLTACSDDVGGSKTPSSNNSNPTNNQPPDTSVPDVGPAEDVATDTCSGSDCEEPPACDPQEPGCACRPGQMRLCSSVGDPRTFGPQSLCRPGSQRCIDGEWEEACHGEFVPEDGVCERVFDDACQGHYDETGECIEGPRGEPADPNVLCQSGSVGEIGDPCSCEVPEGGDEYLRRDQPCYTGPIATLGVGICRAGTRDCRADGSWGECVGEVLPQAEVCGDGIDNDCDGVIDNGCPGCPAGMASCDDLDNGVVTPSCPDGSARNACGGCGPVGPEICGDGIDNNCDGAVDEGCPCTATTQRCYVGPPEAAGVGECSWGVQHCLGERWGPCEGSVLPTLELCGADGTGDGRDNNCDGRIDEGCGCPEGATRACGTDVGECSPGVQTCTGGAWGACEGAVGPQPEACDGLDNNCNGVADEGLLNACGTCGEPCYIQDARPAQSGVLDEGAQIIAGDDPDNPSGRPGLTLARQTFFPPYLWAANTDQHTVSKFNTETNVEEGRYWVGLSPSRTAVDLDGNMWVVGRNDGRVTKVLWDPTQCRGSNTSSPTASGATLINSQADPMADDCVVYSGLPSYEVGDPRNNGRGVAVSPDGMVWIGYSDQSGDRTRGAVQPIHPHTFEPGPVYPSTNVPVFAPDANGVQRPVLDGSGNPVREHAGSVYGLVGDSRGYIYAAGLWESRGLFRFNTATREWDAYYTGFNCEVYGIAVDGQNRIWMGCSNANWGARHADVGGGIAVFDPATDRVTRFFVPREFQGRLPQWQETSPVLTSCPTSGDCASRFGTTGIAVEPATGNVWATVRSIGYMLRLELDENDFAASEWTYIPVLRDDNLALLDGLGLGTAPDMRGIGFDRLGYVWHLGMSSRHVFKVDPATNRRIEAVGLGTGGHYTYSDFTGSTAFSFTAPRGFWRYYFDTGFPNARLDALSWEAMVPDDTTVGVRVRPLNGQANPIGPWLPAEGGGVASYIQYPRGQAQDRVDLTAIGGPLHGQIFEVEIRMTSNDPDVRPILHDFKLEWQRP